ncbi:MAG: hypothetical protein ACFFCV_01415 [Promethearchaeota archaeon]
MFKKNDKTKRFLTVTIFLLVLFSINSYNNSGFVTRLTNKNNLRINAESDHSGIIALWSGPLNTIPNGWKLCDGSGGTLNISNKFVYSTDTMEEPGTIGGSSSHNHSYTMVPYHDHGITSTAQCQHNHNYLLPQTTTLCQEGGTTEVVGYSTSTSTPDSATHSHEVEQTGNPICYTSEENILPPYYELAFIEKETSDPSVPIGLIVMWAGSIEDLPTGWIICNGSDGTPDLRDKFIQGVSSGEDPGSSGGSLTHNHTYTDIPIHSHSLSSEGFSHTHDYDMSAFFGTFVYPGGAQSFFTDTYHTYDANVPHNHTMNEAGITECTTQNSNHLPPYYKLAFIMNTVITDALPMGSIVMWGNLMADIPSGWYQCNGSYGTPNMVNRFPRGLATGEDPGITGGNETHRHIYSEVPLHTHGILNDPMTHSHDITYVTGLTGLVTDPGGVPIYHAPSTARTLQTTTSSAPHNHTVNPTGDAICYTEYASNFPPFIELTYIQKSLSIYDPSPADGAIGLHYNPTLSVETNDLEGDDLNITFYDASDDSIIDFDIVSGGSGTASITWSGLTIGTSYSWYIIADDGTKAVRFATWSFTTNHVPNKPINPSPSNGAIVVSNDPALSVDVFDDDGDNLTVTFYNASDNSIIDSDIVSGGSGTASITWSGLSSWITYSWYAIADDGLNTNQSAIWSFIINHIPHEPTNPSPSNGATVVSYNPALSVDVFDDDGNDLTVTFYDASDDSVIDSDIVYGGSGTASVIWSSLLPGTTYSWYATAADGLNKSKSATWLFTTVHTPNEPTNPSPSNGAIDVNYNPALSVDVFDDDGDDLTVTFYNASDDSVINSDIVYGGSGTASVIWSGLLPGTTYSWYAIADDGLNKSKSVTWSFTTNLVPNEPINPSPSDGALNVNFNPTLSVDVFDDDGDDLTVTFYNASDDSVINSDIVYGGSGTASVIWSGLLPGTTYSWYAIADDGLNKSKSTTWSFITGHIPNEPTNPSPFDGAIIINNNPTLSVDVYDSDGDDLTVTFYDASDDSVITSNIVSGGIGTASIPWFGLSLGITYSWYAIADDGLNTNQSTTWSFTINQIPNEPTNPSPSDLAMNIDYNPTLSVDVYDGNGDDLTVTFYDASDSSVIGTDIIIGGSGTASATWSGLSAETTYSWYVVADDGISTAQSPDWTFTTVGEEPNPPSNPPPTVPGFDMVVPVLLGAATIISIRIYQKRKKEKALNK